LSVQDAVPTLIFPIVTLLDAMIPCAAEKRSLVG
jgi:hypothetical protein